MDGGESQPAIPQVQVFGENPLKFDDPTIYNIREVLPGMTDEGKICLGEVGNAVNLFLLVVRHAWENLPNVVNGRVSSASFWREPTEV
jgi:hypothetical protein